MLAEGSNRVTKGAVVSVIFGVLDKVCVCLQKPEVCPLGEIFRVKTDISRLF